MEHCPPQASLPGQGGHCPSLPSVGVAGLWGREGTEGATGLYPQGWRPSHT